MLRRLVLNLNRVQSIPSSSAVLVVNNRYFHKIEKVSRDHVRIYKPGEKIPKEQDQKRARIVGKLIEAPMDAANRAVDIFNEVMAEAVKSSKRQLIVLEGQRLVEEGLKAGLPITYLFLQKSIKTIPPRLDAYVNSQHIKVLHVSQHAIKTWSTLTTPPGIVGIFVKPKPADIANKAAITNGTPVTVICDNVREPGNMGSILRDAAAAGCKRVILSKGCVDPWDPKTLRVACGAHFYIPIVTNYPMHSLFNCMEVESRGERLEETMEAEEKKNIRGGGNENGPSELSSSARVSPSSFALFLADSNDTEMNERKSVPVVSYTDMDYTKIESIYLVVGGETEGLSREVLQVSEGLQQIQPGVISTTVARLRIPVCRQIESLNASHAFAVISFEILRQYQLKVHPKLNQMDEDKQSQSESLIV